MFNMCSRSVEFRATDEGAGEDGRTLEGYAAVFDQDTEINSWEGRFVERVAKGAFRKTLRERTPIMQYDHGRDTRVGSVPIGVYDEIREDDHGLFVKGRVFDNPVVEPIRQAIEGGAVTGMSFKFRVTRDEWSDVNGKRVRGDEIMNLLYNPGERGPLQRTIKEVALFEAGPVATPAYAGTSVGVRSFEELTEADREEVVAAYRASMDEDTEDRDEQDEALGRWVDAESRWQTEAWLEAEKRWTADVEAWLTAEEQFRADDAKKPYGDVTYADPGYQKDGKKRYPLDTKDHVKSAWSYINMPKNAEKYTAAQVSAIKGRIKAAAKTLGVEIDSEKKSDDAGTTTSRTSRPNDAARRGTSHWAFDNPPLRKKEKAMTLEELRARLVDIDIRFEELGAEHRDAELPEAAQEEWDGLEAERSQLELNIERIEKRNKRLEALARQEDHVERTPSFHRSRDIYDVSEIRSQARSEEHFVELARDNAKRAIDDAKIPQGVSREAAQARMREILDLDDEGGSFAKRMLLTGSPAYERAWGKAVRGLTTSGLSLEEQRDLAVGSNPDGGYAVPVQLDPTVIHTQQVHVNPLRQIARVVQITGKEWQGVVSDGITVQRSGEGTPVTPDSPTFTQPKVKAERVDGFVPFSFEIDQDWPALRSEISSMLAEAKELEEAVSFMTGSGVGVQPEGLLTALGASQKVDASGTNLAAGLNAGDIYALEDALPVRYRGNAKFLGNKSIYGKVRQFDTNGGANMWERIGAGLPSQLIGYPIYESSVMDGYGVSKKVLILGDFSKFLIVDRIGMNVELVPHVFSNPSGTSVVPTGQRGLLAIWRNNCKVLVPDAFRYLLTKAA